MYYVTVIGLYVLGLHGLPISGLQQCCKLVTNLSVIHRQRIMAEAE